MKKKKIANLIVTTLITTASVTNLATTSAFADTNNTIIENQTISSKQDIIIEKGNVLTHEDFDSIYNQISENPNITDSEVLDLIIKKIENKNLNRSYSIFGRKVTKEELKLVASHPIYATEVFNNSNIATKETNNLYNSDTTYLGNGDAFRHAYWNALNVKSVGSYWATQFANAHESETPDGLDKTMDLRNNDKGRYIGNQNKNSSNSTIKSKVIQAVNDGLLWRIVNNKLVKTDSTGRK